jgi:NAD-dependent deacetylase
MHEAASIVSGADIFAVIGTSLVVYPAASLVDYVPRQAPIFLIDPNDVRTPGYRPVTFIKEKASQGVKILMSKIIKN